MLIHKKIIHSQQQSSAHFLPAATDATDELVVLVVRVVVVAPRTVIAATVVVVIGIVPILPAAPVAPIVVVVVLLPAKAIVTTIEVVVEATGRRVPDVLHGATSIGGVPGLLLLKVAVGSSGGIDLRGVGAARGVTVLHRGRGETQAVGRAVLGGILRAGVIGLGRVVIVLGHGIIALGGEVLLALVTIHAVAGAIAVVVGGPDRVVLLRLVPVQVAGQLAVRERLHVVGLAVVGSAGSIINAAAAHVLLVQLNTLESLTRRLHVSRDESSGGAAAGRRVLSDRGRVRQRAWDEGRRARV